MADKSFGVKQVNLINASGTPRIESPNNLNINAVNVAISTDISVGGQLSLGTGTSISSPGSNILTLGTNSAERVRINSTGVGIKTNDPDAPLTIQESGDVQIRLKNSSGTTKAYLGTAGAFGSGSTDDLRIRSEGNILFGSAGSEKMRMLSGGGLTFNGDTAAANALDDYEEGSFTITLANSVTINTQTQARYVKIGSMVMVTGQFRIDNANGGAVVVVNNLPFVSLNTGGNDGGFSPGAIRLYQYPNPGGYGNYISLVQKNDTNLYFYYSRASDTDGAITASSGGYIAFSCVYHTAS